MVWARTGRSPRRNSAQGNALGVGSLTNRRAVSAKGKRNTLHWLLLRLQRANYFVHCYPGCYPGLYSYWAFSPSLLMCLFADTALSLKMVYFIVVNNVEEINNEITENTKMRKWYKGTKERRRSDENNEKKCVVILLRFFVKSEVRQLCFSLY